MRLDKFQHVLSSLEEQDKTIMEHSERVAMMCYEFSKKFDLEKGDREVLYLCGLLHEVGKYNMEPTVVIDKTKYDLNNVYPLFSQILIGSIEGFERIAKIVGQHLENIDGSGYPKGLKGEEIHLYATMLHMCDFYDTCRMNGDNHSMVTANMRKQVDVMFPKKMITPFLKMMMNNSDLNFKYA